MAKKYLSCFFISSDKNSCESLLSKMAVNWICMPREKNSSQRMVQKSLIEKSYQSSYEYIVSKSKNKCPGRPYLCY